MHKSCVLACFLSMTVAAAGSFAQSASTRAEGMASALTSVADGVDVLSFNPAGLGFLSGFHLSIAAGGAAASETPITLSGMGQRAIADGYLTAAPQIAFAVRNLGASSIYSMRLTPDSAVRNMGAAGGVGFALGPLALGADLRWYQSGALQPSAWPAAGSADMLKSLLGMALQKTENTSTHWEAGAGAMLKLGELALGAYVPNVISALSGGDGASFLEEARAGVSWYPIHVRSTAGIDVFSLLLSADLWDLGLAETRLMRLGAEFNFNIVILGVMVRAGYSAGIPGSVSSLPETIYLGGTAHLLFANVDIGVKTTRSALPALSSGGPLSVPVNQAYANLRFSI